MKLRSIATGTLLCCVLAACGGGGEPAASQSGGMQGTRAQVSSASMTPVEIFHGKLADYAITKTDAGFTVADKVGTAGSRTVPLGAELHFQDASVETKANGPAAQAYRLYQAAFSREPDLPGLGFQVSVMGAGVTLTKVAQGFVDSAEFSKKYGSVDNRQYANLLYRNILGREGEAAGVNYWVGRLDSGAARAEVLAEFSESNENKALVSERTRNGIAYVPYIVEGSGQASTIAAHGGKVSWGRAADMMILLRDARGSVVSSASLSCSAEDERALQVSSDCRTATGRLLGDSVIVVRGSGVTAKLPVKVIPERRVLATSSVSELTHAVVTPDGNVLAWGNNGGRLGQGVPSATLESSNVPLYVKDTTGTGKLSSIAAASVGEYGMLALSENGEVLAWGGQATLPRYVPSPTGSGRLSRVVQVAIGEDNAVGLADDGTVFSWGSYPAHGAGNDATFPNVVKDPTGTAPLTGIVSVSAGRLFSMALTADGKVYAWGWNSDGQTGRGTRSTSEPLPALVRKNDDGAELSNIVAISAGHAFGLALTADGKVYAWGQNSYGNLGQGARTASTNPPTVRAVLVKDPSGTGILSNIAMISAGGHHALAVDRNGKMFSWGRSVNGQLGDGANRPIYNETHKPIAVVGPTSTGQFSDIAAFAAGYYNSLAVTRSGEVYTWGWNFRGALGNGTTASDNVAYPVPVLPPSGAGKLNVAPLAAYPGALR